MEKAGNADSEITCMEIMAKALTVHDKQWPE